MLVKIIIFIFIAFIIKRFWRPSINKEKLKKSEERIKSEIKTELVEYYMYIDNYKIKIIENKQKDEKNENIIFLHGFLASSLSNLKS
jgi:hypothetical protein